MNYGRVYVGITLAVLLSAASLVVSPAHAQGKGIVASATGSGHITVGDDLRNFSFTAQRDSANNSRGQAELHNRSSGIRVHLDINCLHVAGNVATMSGVVSGSNMPDSPFFSEGHPFWFRVVDNGEGNKAPPDLISLTFFFLGPVGVPCTAPLAPAAIPVEHGNVQVR